MTWKLNDAELEQVVGGTFKVDGERAGKETGGISSDPDNPIEEPNAGDMALNGQDRGETYV